ncbi:MAG: prepilin-type N-terminal cleavage/methylation domain-containing protein [Leptolyngbyaceae cyanobacterium SM2_5_2]|nr:prepilin-type N-terminal cleavage/methylation domain-containing protein [Leptolyngbyaceae cyanobacterium SM2_5_2]
MPTSKHSFWLVSRARLSSSQGFTLLEGMIVIVLIALLAAMAAPALMGFLDQRKVNATQFLVYQALRATQQDATQYRQNRQFSLRERDGRIEWASHPVTMAPAQVSHWNALTDGVVLAPEDNTLLRKDGAYYVRFDLKGDVKLASAELPSSALVAALATAA